MDRENKMKKKSGFTLAEILITLTIIGIVAAMVIPGLLKSTNSQEYKATLKKAVAVLSQVIRKSIAINGTSPSDCSGCSAASGSSSLANYFRNSMNVIATGPDNNSFYTADGVLYRFVHSSTAGACNTASTTTDPAVAMCYALVDVNGAKGPNSISTGSTALGSAFYNDQYYIIINDINAVPAGNATNTIAQDAMFY